MPPKAITSKSGSEKADADGNEIIDLTTKKSVFMTKKAPHHEAGEEVKVHPKIAELFITRGYATSEAPKSDKKKDDESIDI